MRSAIATTALPGSVIATRRLPWRTNTCDPELVLERADLLGDPGLGGVQGLGGLGDVQAAAGDFGEAAQLLELHEPIDLYSHNILTH